MIGYYHRILRLPEVTGFKAREIVHRFKHEDMYSDTLIHIMSSIIKPYQTVVVTPSLRHTLEPRGILQGTESQQ